MAKPLDELFVTLQRDIMINPDTVIVDVSTTLGGILGLGERHTTECRFYTLVRDLKTRKWRCTHWHGWEHRQY